MLSTLFNRFESNLAISRKYLSNFSPAHSSSKSYIANQPNASPIKVYPKLFLFIIIYKFKLIIFVFLQFFKVSLFILNYKF